MDAKQRDLVTFLKIQDTRFVIPVYQRNYDWSRENCADLFDDILEVGGSDELTSHFIGSIVYLQDSLLNTGTKNLTIIDGQQRLTTVTLLWAAIRRVLVEQGDESGADRIYRQYLVNEFAELESKLKLKPVKKDDRALHSILDGRQQDDITGFSRLVDNYEYLCDRVKKADLEVVRKGISKLIFVEMALERGKDDPQRIFESLNSTGLDLSQADLIRNYILMDLEPGSQERFYDKYWVQIEENCCEPTTNQSKVSDYIRDFLTLQIGKPPNKDAVFAAFKRQYPALSRDRLESVLGELLRFSQYYRRFIDPSSETDPAIREQLELLQILDVSVTYPFALQLMDDKEKGVLSRDSFIEVIEYLQSYIWRRFVANVQTQGLNRFFAGLYRDLDPKNYVESFLKTLLRRRGAQRWPDDEEIRKELYVRDMYNIQSRNRLYFLERLENHGESVKTRVYDNEDFSIEHIFPQNPNTEWKKRLGAEFEELGKFTNCAANLTLSVHNAKLSNDIFEVKRDLPEIGYRASSLRVDKMHSDFDCWNMENLNKRFDRIVKKFVQIWRYPQHLVSRNGNEGRINIFDIQDPTNSEIRGVTFFNQSKGEMKFKELLQFVAETLFDMDPAPFYTDVLRTKLKGTLRASDLKAPIKLGETFYIEGAHSGREILRRIKLLLQTYQIDDELFIDLFRPDNT